MLCFIFFNDTATTEIYTLSLHDALPIWADVPGAAHAAEHAAIGLLPLFATCDRWDIGGVSTALHPDTGTCTVFVYDGHPGGAGFAEQGWVRGATWLRATREAIAACECPAGCPSTLLGAASRLCDSHDEVALPDLADAVSSLRSKMGDQAFHAAWESGRAMPIDQVMDEIAA